MLQKLEADIRGHIRLEHEMKLHLDYLEGKVEELENASLKSSQDKKSFTKKIKDLEEKLAKAQTKYEESEKHAK
jgi:hypothetical protein